MKRRAAEDGVRERTMRVESMGPERLLCRLGCHSEWDGKLQWDPSRVMA